MTITWATERPGQNDRLITTRELAEYLQVPVQTIHAWRHRGEGPRASRVGRHLRFRASDVEKWLDQQAEGPAA
jgi:excisionase family DNA binding protein